jgi:hypothetical protein
VSNLGSQFMESRGEPIEVDGRLVHLSHLMAPLPAGVLKVRMRAAGNLEQASASARMGLDDGLGIERQSPR